METNVGDGTWKLSEDGKTLTISILEKQLVAKIVKMTDKAFTTELNGKEAEWTRVD